MNFTEAKEEARRTLLEEVKRLERLCDIKILEGDLDVLDSRYFVIEKNYMFFINEKINLDRLIPEGRLFDDTVMVVMSEDKKYDIYSNAFSHDMKAAEDHFKWVLETISARG